MMSETISNTPENAYDASSITVLNGLEAVRRRPGMYVGDTSDGSGLCNMVYYWAEEFAIRDAKSTSLSRVDIILNANGSVTVEHDGNGLPVEPHPRETTSMAEYIMTTPCCPEYFGLPVVNALSSRLELTIRTGGKEYSLTYENGEPLHPLDLIGTSLGRSGARVTFLPSAEIFEATAFDYVTLEERFRELAFFNPGLRITLTGQRDGRRKSTILRFEQGLADFVRYLDRTNEPLVAGPFTVTGARDGIEMEAALGWSAGCEESIVCFTNQMRQRCGGTHRDGARAAVTQALSNHSSMNGVPITASNACTGLICVLSVKAGCPQYADATRDELTSPEIGGAVESIMVPALTAWFAEHPSVAEYIAGKIASTVIARQAAGNVCREGQHNER